MFKKMIERLGGYDKGPLLGLKKSNIIYVLKQALISKRFSVMSKKVIKRLANEKGRLSSEENLEWIRSRCSHFEELARKLDSNLWEESRAFAEQLQAHARQIMQKIEFDLGGGGYAPALYFITRYMRPDCIVETGVSAGYSSSAFLSAIKVNSMGRLYSSDFPHFRLPNPEEYVGVLVEEELKDNWDLFIDGDEANIPRILEQIDHHIDLFHYDSDKTYSGRKFVMTAVEQKLCPSSLILMDDIQDNSFFHDYVEDKGCPTCRIYEFEGKYVGLIGALGERRS